MTYISGNRELFNQIASEDMEFAHDEDSDFEIPEFGNATSDYDEVLQIIYIFFYLWILLILSYSPPPGRTSFLRLLAVLLHSSSILVAW